MERARSGLREFFAAESAGGIVLIAAAMAALAAANSPLAGSYFTALHAQAGPLDVHDWVNEAAMSLFFLVVGLEIKREVVAGELADPLRRRLPVVAAAAGMIVPALVYVAVTGGGAGGLARGWAIPAATDIAFAIGVMALLGRRVPPQLRLFLTTVAIVDDMGAVAIIAIAYSQGIDFVALAGAGAILLAIFALNRRGVVRLWPYLLLALALWIAVFRAGIHPTVAGVLAALVIPTQSGARLEHALNPWVAFVILPLFGWANAGVSFGGISAKGFASPLVIGVAVGLFVGKQIGILGGVALAEWLGIAHRPPGVGWAQIYGVALLAGIGFTMSLFIGGLAFANATLVDEVTIGVLGGSIVSALAGYCVLSFAASKGG